MASNRSNRIPTGPEGLPDGSQPPPERVILRRHLVRTLRELDLPLLPVLMIVAVLLASFFADALTAYGPYEQSLPDRLSPPSWQHFLGTDSLGRDVFARVLAGARTTAQVASLALFIGGGVGLILGLLSGYIGGWVDAVIMRIGDSMLAIPTVFFGLLFAVTLRPGFLPVVMAIALGLWSQFVRIIRAEVLSLKERDFIIQARVNGCSSWRIQVVHLLPNVLNSFVVLASLHIGGVILAEASLSFLGAGIPPPQPSWGQMAAEGQRFVTSSAWWLSVVPGAAITLTVVSVFKLGDWIRDHFDPRLRNAEF